MIKPEYSIEFKKSAVKELASLERRVRERISDRIDALAENPRPTGAIKLKGSCEAWRIRVGEYRVIYEIRDDVLLVLVLRAAKRSEAYS